MSTLNAANLVSLTVLCTASPAAAQVSSSTTAIAGESRPATAQTPTDAETEIEDIIVTGRGRRESILEIPTSETAFTSQAVEDARIDRVDDFIGLTPGVTIANAQDSGTNFITIRGMSQTRNGEPPVAVLLDGVLQINSRTFDQALFDIDNIEVLRGPQGALYGRNATNGAIIINTKGPTDSFESYIQGTYGRGNEFALEGSVSGPLVEDRIGFRLSARYGRSDGILENLTLDDEVDFFEELNLRGHVHFDVTKDFTADVRARLTMSDGGSLNYTFQGVTVDDAGSVTGFAAAEAVDADSVQRQFFANNRGVDDRDIGQVSLRLAYDFGFGRLISVTAYDWLNQFIAGDTFPYTADRGPILEGALVEGTQTQFVDVKAFSQDLRLQSPDDQRFRWMVGGYILQTDRLISSGIGADLGQGIARVEDSPLLGDVMNPTTVFISDDNNNLAWALFLNLAYDILKDRLELAVAARYDRDIREQTVSNQNGAYDADGMLLAPVGVPGAVNEETFDRFQPKISLRFLINEGAAVYASWGRGFRSGQFNQNGTAAAAADAGIEGVSDVFGQENSETFEAGFKLRFFNGLLRAAGAAYRTEVDNAPYFVFIGPVGAQVLAGIDEVEVLGGELEVSAFLPFGLSGYLGLGISETEITAYSLNPDAVGNDAPYVPGATFNAGLQYRGSLTSYLGIFGRVDYEFRGEQFWDPENSTSRSAINLLNVRAGLEAVSGLWSMTASIQNLLDEEYNSEWVLGGFAHAGVPLVWRVDLRVNF